MVIKSEKMDRISTMQSQRIEKFKNPFYTIDFMVENNPSGVIRKLYDMGYSVAFTGNLISDKQQAKKILRNFYINKQTGKIKELINNVNYLDNSTESAEYTKGFKDYVLENTPSGAVDERAMTSTLGREFSWDGLLAGLGAGLTTYTGISGAGTTGSDANSQAAAELEAQKKKQKTWLIVGAVILVIVVIGIVILVKKKKAKS